MTAPNPKLDELVAVLARLRAPGGCAWDREQTHESLVKHLIEETHELVEAIESGDRDQLIEELGDVLYQVIFHSDLAAHTPGEDFTLEDVAEHMSAKMISRHPHVFGDTVAETSADVVAAWDRLKAVEKPERTSVLDGIPAGMPSLLLAEKVLGRAAKVGVSVDTAAAGSGVGSVAAAASTGAAPFGSPSFADEDELGAVLLGIVASARSSGLDAERALRSALRGLQNEVRAVEAGE